MIDLLLTSVPLWALLYVVVAYVFTVASNICENDPIDSIFIGIGWPLSLALMIAYSIWEYYWFKSLRSRHGRNRTTQKPVR